MTNVYIIFYENNVMGVYELKIDALKNLIEDIKDRFSDNLESAKYELNAFLAGNSNLCRIENAPFISK